MNLMDTDSITAFRDSETEAAITPWLSIIIPAYQLEDYIADCLNSILSQQFRDFELIVVLDGPTDRSEEILMDFQHSDDRIRLIRQSNKGLSSARNRGFKEARGTYILFVDGDDLLEHNALSQLYFHTLDHNDLDLLFFSYDILWQDSEQNSWVTSRQVFHQEESYGGLHTGPELLQLMMENQDYWPQVWRYLIRKEFLSKTGLLFREDLRYYEDLPFTTEALLRANQVLYLPVSYYHYRRRPNSITYEEKTPTHIISFFQAMLAIAGLSHNNRSAWQKVPYFPEYLMSLLNRNQIFYSRNVKENNNVLFDILGSDEGIYHLLIDYPVQLSQSLRDLKLLRKQNQAYENSFRSQQQRAQQLQSDLSRLSAELQLMKTKLEEIEANRFIIKLTRKIFGVSSILRSMIKDHKTHRY